METSDGWHFMEESLWMSLDGWFAMIDVPMNYDSGGINLDDRWVLRRAGSWWWDERNGKPRVRSFWRAKATMMKESRVQQTVSLHLTDRCTGWWKYWGRCSDVVAQTKITTQLHKSRKPSNCSYRCGDDFVPASPSCRSCRSADRADLKPGMPRMKTKTMTLAKSMWSILPHQRSHTQLCDNRHIFLYLRRLRHIHKSILAYLLFRSS